MEKFLCILLFLLLFLNSKSNLLKWNNTREDCKGNCDNLLRNNQRNLKFKKDRKKNNIHNSHLSEEFLDCMIDVGKNLPIHSKECLLKAHHYDAADSLWNENIRFEPFNPNLSDNPVILEIGGCSHASDSQKFRSLYPNSYLHIYEPVPSFIKSLKAVFQEFKNVSIHEYGIGDTSRVVPFETEKLAGESTFIMESKTNSNDSTINLNIVSIEEELNNILKTLHASKQQPAIDLLHVNCEGCEWSLFEKLVTLDAIKEIRFIQISFHNYAEKGIGYLLPKYCLIREKLKHSHTSLVAVPFGWERWILNSIYLQ